MPHHTPAHATHPRAHHTPAHATHPHAHHTHPCARHTNPRTPHTPRGPRSHTERVAIDALNGASLVPKKDHEANVIWPAALQLPH
eukprot:2200349-Prymnesium_polylepis.1